jgi:hypothetical protein
LKNGDLGTAFRKGLSQIAEWDQWIDGHFSSLNEVFSKFKQKGKHLPDAFVSLDKTRIYYLVIAGRRSDFREKTYLARRKKLRDNGELILHYDNLVDAAQNIIGRATY